MNLSRKQIIIIFILIILALSSFLPYVFLKEAKHIQFSKLKTRWIRFFPDFDGDLLDDNIEKNITFTSHLDPDSDNDFFPDGAEYNYWNSPNVSANVEMYKPTGDIDGDGLTNILDPDSDGDSVPDGWEVLFGLHPGKYDSFREGITDRYKFLIYYFDPYHARDNDRDKLPDNWEQYFNVYEPFEDTDGDGVDNFHEWMNGSDPTLMDERYGYLNTEDELADTDEDGLTDYLEKGIGLDPFNPDYDNDGLLDGEEYLYWSLPFDADTDGDKINDSAEVWNGTSPYIKDSDHDHLLDPEELKTNPLVPDSDRNLILDGDEFLAHDIDRDGLNTLLEMDDTDGYTTDPLDPDTDNDGLIDGAEDKNRNGRREGNDPTDRYSDWGFGGETDPNEHDTDGGGLDDGFEVSYGFDPLNPNDDDISEEPPPQSPPPPDTPEFEIDPWTCLIVLLVVIVLLVAILTIYYFTQIRRKFIEEIIEILETAEKVLYELDTSDAIRNAIYTVYRRFLEAMKNYNLTRKESMTVQEFVVIVRAKLPLSNKPVQGLTDVFEEARYSDHKLGVRSKNRAIKNFKLVKDELITYKEKDPTLFLPGTVKGKFNTVIMKIKNLFKKDKKS